MVKIDESMRDSFEDCGNMVVVFDDLGSDVVHDFVGDSRDSGREFKSRFKILEQKFLGDPLEDFDEGITFVRVIERLADGKLFGFSYWCRHGDAYVEPNGSDYGFVYDIPSGVSRLSIYYPQAYVFVPVEPYMITGYKVDR